MPPHRRGRPRIAQDGPHPVDVHVAARVKLRRVLQGLTQSQLGEAVGLTFQQIQKYERGGNRVSASMLHQIAQVLDVPISFFFDDMAGGGTLPASAPADLLGRTESLELVRSYYLLPEIVRQQVFLLVKVMAQNAF